MAAFERISGFHRISYCKSCKMKIRSVKANVFYCDSCQAKMALALEEEE